MSELIINFHIDIWIRCGIIYVQKGKCGMKIDFIDWIVLGFADDLDRTLQNCSEKEYLELKEKINAKIEHLDERIETGQEDIYMDEFGEVSAEDRESKIVDYRMEQYDKLSSYFQKLYARFENQLAICEKKFDPINKGRVFQRVNLRRYPIVNQTNLAVNVMKHGVGRSYDELKNLNSKFVQEPVEFGDMDKDYVDDVILNIEYSDLKNFVNEAKKLWWDVAKRYKMDNDLVR